MDTTHQQGSSSSGMVGGGDEDTPPWPRRGPYRCGGCGMPKKTACVCFKSGTTLSSTSGGSLLEDDELMGSFMSQFNTSSLPAVPHHQYAAMSDMPMRWSGQELGVPMMTQHVGCGMPLTATDTSTAADTRILCGLDAPSMVMLPMAAQAAASPAGDHIQGTLPSMTEQGGSCLLGLHQQIVMPHPPSSMKLPTTMQHQLQVSISCPPPMVGRAERCGYCRTCSNPRLKKACLTIRRRKQQHDGASDAADETMMSSFAGCCSSGSSAGVREPGVQHQLIGAMGRQHAMTTSSALSYRPPGMMGQPLLGTPPGPSSQLMMQQQQTAAHQFIPKQPPPPQQQHALPKMSRSMSVPSISLHQLQHSKEWTQSGGCMGNSTPAILDPPRGIMVPTTTYQQQPPPSPLLGEKELAPMPEDREAGDCCMGTSAVPEFLNGEMLGSHDTLAEGKCMLRQGFGAMSKAESMPNLSQLDHQDDSSLPSDLFDVNTLVGYWSGELTLERFGAESPSSTLNNDHIMDLDKYDLQSLGDMVPHFNMIPTHGECVAPLSSGKNVAAGASLVVPVAASATTLPASTALSDSSDNALLQAHNMPNTDLAKQMHDAPIPLAEQSNSRFLTNMTHQYGSPVMPQFTGMQPAGAQGLPMGGTGNLGLMQCTQASGMEHLSAKRIQRIMANRHSAAKSRVKKLQHTADLEARVKELQTSVEELRPKVAELHEEQRAMQAHNGALKERLQATRKRAAYHDGSIIKLQHSICGMEARGSGALLPGGPRMGDNTSHTTSPTT